MEVCPPIVLLLQRSLGMGQFCFEHRALAPRFQLLHLLFDLRGTRVLGRPTQKLAVEYQSLALTWARARTCGVMPVTHSPLAASAAACCANSRARCSTAPAFCR